MFWRRIQFTRMELAASYSQTTFSCFLPMKPGPMCPKSILMWSTCVILSNSIHLRPKKSCQTDQTEKCQTHQGLFIHKNSPKFQIQTLKLQKEAHHPVGSIFWLPGYIQSRCQEHQHRAKDVQRRQIYLTSKKTKQQPLRNLENHGYLLEVEDGCFDTHRINVCYSYKHFSWSLWFAWM